jgi:alpha-tubulin suppressor-like RCC1 family protein
LVAISAGNWHNCGLDSVGDVLCWGANTYLQSTPPSPSRTYSQVSAGYYGSCAVRDSDGGIDCWGNNTNNQYPPSTLTGFRQVSVGYAHICAIDTLGLLHCWGSGMGAADADCGTGSNIDCGQANPP